MAPQTERQKSSHSLRPCPHRVDSGRPNAKIVELGGTGRTHDWSISAEFVQKTKLPVYLAGGLNQHNVGEVIRAIRRWGVDLCSGVGTDGVLEEEKLAAFFNAVRDANDARP